MFEEDGEDEEGSRGPVAALRVKLKMARSYLALGQQKNALPVLDQVDTLCSSAAAVGLEGGSHCLAAAGKEALVLRAWAARGLRDKALLSTSLARITQLLEESMAAAAGEMVRGATAASTKARPYFAAPSASVLVVDGRRKPEGIGGQEGEQEEAEAAAEEEWEPAASMPPVAIELELCLEYGMLARELGRKQDFLSVMLSLVELAVFQSKAEFRRTRKKRTYVFCV
jgi:hypothetical protein